MIGMFGLFFLYNASRLRRGGEAGFIGALMDDFATMPLVMRRLLDAVGLNIDQPGIGGTLEQTLMPEGYPLTAVGILKLKIAYALAALPKILVLTSQFDTFSQEARIKIMRRLREQQDVTVICFTHRPDLNDFDKFFFCDFTEQQEFDSAAEVLAAYSQDIASVTKSTQKNGDGHEHG